MGGCEEGSELRSEPLIDCLFCVVGVIGLAMDHAADAHRTDLMTITRHVLNEQSKHPESRGDFSILLSHIVLGCKFVCSAVNKVSLPLWVFLFFFLVKFSCGLFGFLWNLIYLRFYFVFALIGFALVGGMRKDHLGLI